MIHLIRSLARKPGRRITGAGAPAAAVGPGEAASRAQGPRSASQGNVAAPGGTSGTAALSVQNLGKRFGARAAFEDVSFEVGYGEVFGVPGAERGREDDNRADARHPAGTVLGLGDGHGSAARAGERRGDPPPDLRLWRWPYRQPRVRRRCLPRSGKSWREGSRAR